MTQNFLTAENAAEVTKIGLAILGVVALIYETLKRILGHREKHKELTDVDKSIKAALREALEDDKKLREKIRQNAEEKAKLLASELETKKEELGDANDALAFLAGRAALTDFLVTTITETTPASIENAWQETMTNQAQLLEPLLLRYDFEQKKVSQTLKRVFRPLDEKLKIPEGIQYELLLHALRQIRPVVTLTSALERFGEILTAALDRYAGCPEEENFLEILDKALQTTNNWKTGSSKDAVDAYIEHIDAVFTKVAEIKNRKELPSKS